LTSTSSCSNRKGFSSQAAARSAAPSGMSGALALTTMIGICESWGLASWVARMSAPLRPGRIRSSSISAMPFGLDSSWVNASVAFEASNTT